MQVRMPFMQVDLKSNLWEAANILRGSAVDRTDWKGYILPLLFFKRISDVWDEETAEAAETYGGADPSQFPEVHRFQVPEGCHVSGKPYHLIPYSAIMKPTTAGSSRSTSR
jgi:type I restriction enzyme M protein